MELYVCLHCTFLMVYIGHVIANKYKWTCYSHNLYRNHNASSQFSWESFCSKWEIFSFVYFLYLIFEFFLALTFFVLFIKNGWKVVSNVSNKKCSFFIVIVTICQFIVNYCGRCFSNSSWLQTRWNHTVRVHKVKVIMLVCHYHLWEGLSYNHPLCNFFSPYMY